MIPIKPAAIEPTNQGSFDAQRQRFLGLIPGKRLADDATLRDRLPFYETIGNALLCKMEDCLAFEGKWIDV